MNWTSLLKIFSEFPALVQVFKTDAPHLLDDVKKIIADVQAVLGVDVKPSPQPPPPAPPSPPHK